MLPVSAFSVVVDTIDSEDSECELMLLMLLIVRLIFDDFEMPEDEEVVRDRDWKECVVRGDAGGELTPMTLPALVRANKKCQLKDL